MSKKFACVYGGASNRLDSLYINELEKLGSIIAENGFSLVYGAGATGCMGAVARGVRDGGGYILGISPHFIRDFEPLFDCDELVMVDTMDERKLLMEKHADIFIIAPGGLGTMDELFQILVLKHLRQMSTPIILLNINGFYDKLLDFLDDLTRSKAIIDTSSAYFDVVTSVDDEILLNYLKEIKK